MSDKFKKILLPEIDVSNSKKRRNIKKDLFTKKLGEKISFNFDKTQKNNKIFSYPEFTKNIRAFPKNERISFFSLNKEKNLRKIWNQKKKLKFYNLKELTEEESKKIQNLKLDFSFNNVKNKKLIKKFSNNKEKERRHRKIISDSTSDIRNYNSYIDNTLRFDKKLYSFDIKKSIENKKINFQNSRIKNKSNNNFGNVIDRISKNEKRSKTFIKSFFELLLDIHSSYEFYNKIIPLINKLNERFFFLFQINSFPINPLNIKFLDLHKISSILNISLIFLSKDKNLYKENILKMKELLQKYIKNCLNLINHKIFESSKINDFFHENETIKEITTLRDILNEIIYLLFNDKKNDYKIIYKSLKQLVNNINNQTPNQIFYLVKDTILFCHNCIYNNQKILKEEQFKSNKINKFEKFVKENNEITPPFIKRKMVKKFCLVLDLDETLIHNLYLPFGEYFFVRPGVFDLLENIHDFYETIIFTAAKKDYAFNIIEKIDLKNYIDFILYKSHNLNINGNLVKKLDLIGRDLNKIIYVDNLEKNAKYNKKNLYLISSWFNDIFDKELNILKNKLIHIATCGKFDKDITQGLLEK